MKIQYGIINRKFKIDFKFLDQNKIYHNSLCQLRNVIKIRINNQSLFYV